ncbi:hypothetical protein ACJROX_03070 [Pseudalkalibacillus sp. A8]|uniref:hypothetical protein n=1 Tax=Pseudalkalibacillus sp. A8 TaxID=3382641 RepID=UPI0038B64B06
MNLQQGSGSSRSNCRIVLGAPRTIRLNPNSDQPANDTFPITVVTPGECGEQCVLSGKGRVFNAAGQLQISVPLENVPITLSGNLNNQNLDFLGNSTERDICNLILSFNGTRFEITFTVTCPDTTPGPRVNSSSINYVCG